ncbi:MAG: DUF541 domain-containing protein [Rhodobacteraceae bacterium]|nr:DUF541 domain-containing protein [Paracoccaceae bacterium]
MFRVLLFVVLAVASPAVAQEVTAGRMTVSGEGSVAISPDMALISLGVTSEAKTAAEALTANNSNMTAVLDRLKARGIAPRDLQTSGLSLQPRWDHRNTLPDGGQRIVAYVVSNQITVRVRDLSTLGSILDIAVSDGANTFHNLQFSVAEDGELMDEARHRAVADARRKAEVFAQAAGVSIGAIVSLDEVQQGCGPVMMARMESMAADAVPVAEGEVAIAARVNVVFEIEQ